MSVSMRSTKAQLYAEIEALRAECDRLRTTNRSNAVTRMVSPPNSLAEFCRIYCTTNGVRSVPGHIVSRWREQAKNQS